MKPMPLILAILAIAATTLAQDANPPADATQPNRARFGGPITLNSDDVPAFPDPPAGFDQRREDISHGQLEMIEYDSKTVGNQRKMQVYTPPGYTKEKKYPV